MNGVSYTLQVNEESSAIHTNDKTVKDFRPLAGALTIVASLIMISYGIGFSSSYMASANYYNITTFYPALYIGLWNICAFPFSLAGGIFLFKRKHASPSIVGMILALASGFVPIIALASPNYVWTNGLWMGLPLIILPTVSLVVTAASKKTAVFS
jgi:hypothetical protein